MKPPVRYARAVMRSDDALGRGMEGALTLLFFLGGGFLLDRWLGTTPLFIVALPVLAGRPVLLVARTISPRWTVTTPSAAPASPVPATAT